MKVLMATIWLTIILCGGIVNSFAVQKTKNLLQRRHVGAHVLPSVTNLLAVEQGVGVEGCKLPSPSGINILETEEQQKVVLRSAGGMIVGGLCTFVLIQLLGLHTEPHYYSVLPRGLILGILFILAGQSHFELKADYENIMPPLGTWGFWSLPGSPTFWVTSSGVAEVFLGYLLMYGSFTSMFISTDVLNASALGLFVLCVAITPANIYMYTHGARLPLSQPSPPVIFHYIRFAIQALLLGLLLDLVATKGDLNQYL